MVESVERRHFQHRPPIVITRLDRERLFELLSGITMSDLKVAHFLREELNRADIIHSHLASTAVIRMGSEVAFVEQDGLSVRRVWLVYPEEAKNRNCFSVLTNIGSALIGLGPGQSIGWIEQGIERRLTVLEVSGRA